MRRQPPARNCPSYCRFRLIETVVAPAIDHTARRCCARVGKSSCNRDCVGNSSNRYRYIASCDSSVVKFAASIVAPALHGSTPLHGTRCDHGCEGYRSWCRKYMRTDGNRWRTLLGKRLCWPARRWHHQRLLDSANRRRPHRREGDSSRGARLRAHGHWQSALLG